MIELTVKTLDSQNHSFSLDDDITVRGFKEHIAESVAVPADSQRLIYCGRVLQDDKKLNDYNVNGKVIHLVQRAPPQPGQRGNEGQNQNTGGPTTSHFHRTHYRIIRDPQNSHTGPNAQVHGNAMYLGAMTLPTEVVEGHGLPLPQLSNTLSNSRMVMAERMLTNANRILDRLDNPSSAATENSNERQNSTGENSDVNMDTSQTESTQSGSAGPAFMSQEDAIEIDTEPVRPPPPVSRAPRELKRWETLVEYATRDILNIVGCHEIPNRAEDDPEEVEVSTSNETQPGTANQQQSRDNILNEDSNNSERPRTTPTLPRPPQMADLLQMLMNTQDRLRPYLERYRVLMATDPVLSATGTGPESVAENQRVIDEVSRILHYVAHANHALSDIIVDMGQAPPRNLSCRPIVIQQSAILQAGIPIQVEAHISVNERNARSNSTEENGTSQASNEASDGPEFRETPAETPQQQNSSSASHQRYDHQQNSEQQPRTDQQQRNQTPLGNLLSSVFNLPSNVEVLMEVSPDSSMDLNSSDEPGSNNASNNNTSGANPMGRGASGMFPWGAPPSDFIRNLMHAVAGHIVQDPSSMNSNQSSNNPTMSINQHTITIDSNGQTSGQSTQARNNVGTHPTTSTQTRSTSRPHVFHSHGIGLGTVSDPFLPCNSHHLRRPSSASGAGAARQNTSSRNQSGAQATASTSSSSSSNSNSPPSPRIINGDRFLDMLRRGLSNGRFAPNRDAFAYSLRNFLRMISDGKVDVKFTNEIPPTVTSGITVADLMEIPSTVEPKGNLIYDLSLLMARSVQVEDVVGLRFYQYNIFSSLRKPIRDFIREKTNSSSGQPDQFVELLLNCLRPYISRVLLPEATRAGNNTGYDVVTSIDNVLRRHLTELVKLFCNEEVGDTSFVKKAKIFFLEIVTQFCNVVRYLIGGNPTELAALIGNLMVNMARDMHPPLSRWLDQISTSICLLARKVIRLPHDKIIPLLVRISPDPSAEAFIPDVANMSKPVESLEPVDTNFPGHEILPPDWVPTIALDGARQRRLAPSMPAGGIPNFSDAYLGCLPCKRRKIIQQEKPQLLANPTSNHSTISASIERMVREGASRAEVAEVEGAAVAVANDHSVRSAFGEAIRDCVQPRRLEGPDFPNPIRFPNSTKFFYEDSSPKE